MNIQTRSVDVSFGDAAVLGDGLLDRLDAMREISPIYWSETNQCWVVTGHQEVVEGFRGDLPLSNVRLHHCWRAVPEAQRKELFPYFMESLPQWLIDMDPPNQPRLRKLMMKAFSRKVAEDMRPIAREIIGEALDDASQVEVVEFVGTVARKIPSRMILRLLGLGDDLLGPMRRWTDTINATLGGFAPSVDLLVQAEQTMLEMRSYFLPEIEKRRRTPAEDFISSLVTARDGSDQLSDEELLGILYLTLLAGNDSTGSTITLGTLALARHPEVSEYIRNHPENILNAVMELQRYVAMSGTQQRMVSQDFTWHGQTLKTGQYVLLMIAGANRDPRAFPEPLRLDPTRPQDANMTFAPGLHFCIGHLLAKMQLVEFFPELLRRFDIEIVDEKLDFHPSIAFRGLNSLHLRLRPRA